MNADLQRATSYLHLAAVSNGKAQEQLAEANECLFKVKLDLGPDHPLNHELNDIIRELARISSRAARAYDLIHLADRADNILERQAGINLSNQEPDPCPA